jgi:hypothetical protein
MSDVASIQSANSAATASTKKTTDKGSTGGTSFAAALSDAGKRPDGEKTEKVAGHHYEKIVAGPDKGHYLNRTGKARDGEDFAIVERDGRTYHVYDIGKRHEVFMLPNRGSKSVTVKTS